MAVTDYNNLTSITRATILPKVYDQITDEAPILRYCWKNIASKKSGGTQIEVPVQYRLSTQGGWYSGLEVLDSAQETTRTKAVFSWKQLHQPIVLSNIEVAENGGEAKVVDLYKQDFSEAKDAIRDKTATALYQTGSSYNSKAVEGLRAAVDDSTTNTNYGSINRSTYSWWQSYVNSTGGAISLSMLATAYRSLKTKPTVNLTTRSIWDSYEALLQPQARYNFAQNGYPKADGGFDSLMFRGSPIVADDYCTSGYFFLLKLDKFKFFYLAHPSYGGGSGGLAVSNLRQPVTQDGRIGYLFLYGNLVNLEPRKSGRISSVT